MPSTTAHHDADPRFTVHLPEDRRTQISPWGAGNAKLWPDGTPGAYTYSLLPVVTCPGLTQWCNGACYAIRAREQNPVMAGLWEQNTLAALRGDLPPLPADAAIVRMHISGDFLSPGYIGRWIRLVRRHPRVIFWAYTRSWRVPTLVRPLTTLRDQLNFQLFASVDPTSELPPDGWRIAWIDGDSRLFPTRSQSVHVRGTVAGGRAYLCPEQTGRKANCLECGYCTNGQRGGVVFITHGPQKET